MNPISFPTNLSFKETVFKSRRDELVSLITEDINRLRIGTQYKTITKRTVALKINRNPFLSCSDDEVELLFKKCKSKGSYALFFYITK